MRYALSVVALLLAASPAFADAFGPYSEPTLFQCSGKTDLPEDQLRACAQKNLDDAVAHKTKAWQYSPQAAAYFSHGLSLLSAKSPKDTLGSGTANPPGTALFLSRLNEWLYFAPVTNPDLAPLSEEGGSFSQLSLRNLSASAWPQHGGYLVSYWLGNNAGANVSIGFARLDNAGGKAILTPLHMEQYIAKGRPLSLMAAVFDDYAFDPQSDLLTDSGSCCAGMESSTSTYHLEGTVFRLQQQIEYKQDDPDTRKNEEKTTLVYKRKK